MPGVMTAAVGTARPREWLWLPHLDPANAGAPEWVYLLCLRPPVAHARHYVGSTHDIAGRMAKHRAGEGARLLQVAVLERGGDFVLVRTWPGGRNLERAFHDAQNSVRWCPDCCPAPRMSLPQVTSRHIRRARRTDTPVVVLPARPSLAARAAAGRRFARQFLAERQGWTANEIEQAAADFQEPYYSGQRTPEGDALNAAFGQVIEAALAALRAPAAAAS
jgi:hypothetical protein